MRLAPSSICVSSLIHAPLHTRSLPSPTHHPHSYGFCVYVDPRVTDVATAGLHGMTMGDRNLTVRRANQQRGPQNNRDDAPAPAAPMPFQPQANAARVVKLAHASA